MLNCFRYFCILFIFIATCSAWANNIVQPAQPILVRTQTNGGNTAQVWLDSINNAQHSIDIASFFFNSAPRSSMDKVINALNQAAKRGIKIRILIDKSMEEGSHSTLRQLDSSNIEKRGIDFKAVAGGVMHAKYMIVDDNLIFLGSQNFSWKAMMENNETGVTLQNTQLAKTLLFVFNLDWQRANQSKTNFIKTQSTLLNTGLINQSHPLEIGETKLFPAFSPLKNLPAGLNFELPILLNLIQNAKQEIDIDVYQYSDLSGYQGKNRWTALDDALIKTSKRGVKVKLIVSEAMLKKKAGLKGLAQLQKIPNIEIKISALTPFKTRKKIYTRVDHSKFMLVDQDISWIGTGNWEKSYFYNSRDLALIIQNKNLHDQLQNNFQVLWKESESGFTGLKD